MSVTLTDTPDPVDPGQNVQWSIVVHNGGPDPALNIVVSLPMPSGATLREVISPGAWNCTSSTASLLRCVRSGSIAAGATDGTISGIAQVGGSVAAGTVLSATLLTAVRSDLPGGVVAQLTQDVYDRTQTILLLPRGARLLGRYESQLSLGQDRLLVTWDRILLPDGSGLRLPGLISHGAPPGGGTTDYAVEIFYQAIRYRHYTCFLKADTALDMMYMPDAIRAILDLMAADASKLAHRNAFNISAMNFTPAAAGDIQQ